MKFILTLCSVVAISIVVAQSPDMILYNGKIFTADKKQLYVTALAIKGEKIIAVGTTEQIKLLKVSHTTLMDLQGKTVIPGFNDAHTHPGATYPARYFSLQQMPTDPTTWENVKDSVSRLTRELKPGTLIKCTINPDLFEDKRACLHFLDSIAPNHPVILSAWTGHGHIVNSKALGLLGYNANANFAGGWMEKDNNGKLNGVLHEYAGYLISSRLAAKMKETDVVADLKKYYDEALAFGITSNQVMATQLPASLFRKIYASNDFGTRNRIIAFPFTNDTTLGLKEWATLFGRLSDKNEISGVKLILDGTPIERLAYLSAPYSDQSATSGHLNFHDKDIIQYIEFSLKYRQQIMVHAVGDGSVKTMIRLLRSLYPDAFWKNKRVRIEHGDLAIMNAADLETARDMGLIIVQNPMHLALPQVMGPRLGNRTIYLQAMRSLIDNNIPLAFGSDGPNNPFHNIMMATIHPDNPKEAITVEEAVTAYTTGSAYAEFKEVEKGTLTVGKVADLVVLSQDIFSVPVSALPGTQVVFTMVGGKFLYIKAENKKRPLLQR